MLNIGKTISFLNDLYSNTNEYTPERLLDNLLACHDARRSSMFSGDTDVFERNTLEVGVLRSVIISRMNGGELHE